MGTFLIADQPGMYEKDVSGGALPLACPSLLRVLLWNISVQRTRFETMRCSKRKQNHTAWHGDARGFPRPLSSFLLLELQALGKDAGWVLFLDSALGIF